MFKTNNEEIEVTSGNNRAIGVKAEKVQNFLQKFGEAEVIVFSPALGDLTKIFEEVSSSTIAAVNERPIT